MSKSVFAKLASVAFVGSLLGTAPVYAQQVMPCAPRDHVINKLQAEFGEAQVGVGIAGEGSATNILERWENRDGSTWTLLMVRPGSSPLMACILSSGTGWQKLKWQPPEYAG